MANSITPPALPIKDKASIGKIAMLHPKVREGVNNAIAEAETFLPHNCMIRVVQGLRTIDEQNALYAQGRTKPGNIVTKAKGGSSYHNYGLAIDFVLVYDRDGNGTYESVEWNVNKDWMTVVEVFKKRGFEWGGDWKTIVDRPHFQMSFGYTWQQLYRKYRNKEFITGTQYLNI